MRFCTKCGTQCTDTMQFCPACGQALNVTNNHPNMATVTGNDINTSLHQKNYKLFGIIGAVAVILIMILVIIKFQNKNDVYGTWYIPVTEGYVTIEEELCTISIAGSSSDRQDSCEIMEITEDQIVLTNGYIMPYDVNGDVIHIALDGLDSLKLVGYRQ